MGLGFRVCRRQGVPACTHLTSGSQKGSAITSPKAECCQVGCRPVADGGSSCGQNKARNHCEAQMCEATVRQAKYGKRTSSQQQNMVVGQS